MLVSTRYQCLFHPERFAKSAHISTRFQLLDSTRFQCWIQPNMVASLWSPKCIYLASNIAEIWRLWKQMGHNYATYILTDLTQEPTQYQIAFNFYALYLNAWQIFICQELVKKGPKVTNCFHSHLFVHKKCQIFDKNISLICHLWYCLSINFDCTDYRALS